MQISDSYIIKRLSRLIDIVSTHCVIRMVGSGWNSTLLSCFYDDISLSHIWPTQQNYSYIIRFVNIWLKRYRKLECCAVCASDQPISAKGELMVEVFNFQKVSDSSCCVKTFHSVCSNNRKHSTTPLLFPKDRERDMVSHMKWRKLLHSRQCSVG